MVRGSPANGTVFDYVNPVGGLKQPGATEPTPNASQRKKELEERGRLYVRVIELQSIDFTLQQKGISELQETKQQHEQETERDTNSEPWQEKGGSPDWGSNLAPSHSEGPRRLQKDGAHPSSKERSNSEGDASEIRHLQRNSYTKGEALTGSRGKEGKRRITTAEEEARTGARADEELPDAVMSPARQRETASGHKGDSNKGENREERTIPTRRRRRHEHSKDRQQCGKITYLTWAGRLLTLGSPRKGNGENTEQRCVSRKGQQPWDGSQGERSLGKNLRGSPPHGDPGNRKQRTAKNKDQTNSERQGEEKRNATNSAAGGGKTGKRRERGKRQERGEEGKEKDKVELTVKSAPRRPRGAGGGAGEEGTAKRAVDTTSKELSSEAEAGRALLGGEKRREGVVCQTGGGAKQADAGESRDRRWSGWTDESLTRPRGLPAVAEEELPALTWAGRQNEKKEGNKKGRTANPKDKIPFTIKLGEEEKETEERTERTEEECTTKTRRNRARKEKQNGSGTGKQRVSEEKKFKLADVRRAAGRPEEREQETEEEEEKERESEAEKRLIEVCSMVQFRRWVERGQVEFMGAIKLEQLPEEVGEGRKDREACFSAQPPLGTNPTPPSEQIKKEGRLLEKEFKELVDEFSDIFRTLPPGAAKDRKIKHQIPTIPGKVPNYPTKCYNLSGEHLTKLKKYIKDLLDKGFIIPSQSPIAAPVFFVGKPEGSLRLVIDYRALNGITIKDAYPIPRIQDLINKLGKAEWYSKLDLQKGYYQVEVVEEHQWKTAFRTRYGTFQFRVMPFGLSGAPSTFQYLMNSIFIKELDEFVIVYLDDVLIYSRSKTDHMQHLRTVFERMRENELFLNAAKCDIAPQKATYLGFVIEPGRVSPDPKKVETIKNWPEVLRNRKQLRGFLGMVGFYRRLIPNFNKTAHPLHQLLKEDSDMT
ncbi:retrotransposon ty3-gypsy subclass [Cystoisospora suis]|uniref:Retrotransposon ty3-gypsy subclass n=1 Tax=Cystoisospora suis TaxID=483139 RepID=A0A2C6KQ71_9APIC|nr:retrotransposon ty3-gypsy subclass [Cystoisospora suis]